MTSFSGHTHTAPEALPGSPRAGLGQLARSTVIVMLAFGAAKAISLVQTIIIADVFGVGREWDAYVTANRIPEQIFNLIAGGVLAHAFIPIFSGLLAKNDRTGAWRIASHVVNTAFVVTLLISVLSFVGAPWLVANAVAPGFDAQAQSETVSLMRLLLLSTLIFSISGIAMGILQSFNSFLLPALAPILFDLGILFGVAFLIGPLGTYGIAVGAVLGAVLHLGIQIPGLIRYRLRWFPELGWRDPTLHRVIRLMIPRMFDLGLFSFTAIAANNIASRLGEGAVSALDWGWRLMQIPQTLIGTAMGTVIFPTLSALSELGDIDGKREAMNGAVRFILIGTIPSAVGLIVVGMPLVGLLEGGAFDATATALVYSTLRFFALGIIVHSILEVIARSFYADKDTFTPLLVAFGGAAVNLLTALIMTGILTHSAPDVTMVSGLALANTLGVTFEVIVLSIILRRRWRGLHEDTLARSAAKTLLASLVMAAAIVALQGLWRVIGLVDPGRVVSAALVAIEIGIGALVFFAAAFVLRMDELGTLWRLIRRRSDTLAGTERTVS
ncbi:MAG: murein biosynthesis integral membrane protein MurJ [Anaerolinea sp.]|nr:murein biosynthesis integral membrane protein MurJ [Anaerolinea sp.]